MNANISERDAKHWQALTADLKQADDIAHKPHLIESLIRELDLLDATYGSGFAKLFINNKQAESIFTANNIIAEHDEYRTSASFKSNDYASKFGALNNDGVENTDFALRDANGIFKPLNKEFIDKIIEKVNLAFPKLSAKEKVRDLHNTGATLRPEQNTIRRKIR